MGNEDRLSLIEAQHAIDGENAAVLGQAHELRKLHLSDPVHKRRIELGCSSPRVCQTEDLGDERSAPLNPSSIAPIIHARQREAIVFVGSAGSGTGRQSSRFSCG